MKRINDVAKTIVAKMVKQEEDEWPPSCWGTFYQPERPNCKSTNHIEQDASLHE